MRKLTADTATRLVVAHVSHTTNTLDLTQHPGSHAGLDDACLVLVRASGDHNTGHDTWTVAAAGNVRLSTALAKLGLYLDVVNSETAVVCPV